jgi:hypothetical protein
MAFGDRPTGARVLQIGFGRPAPRRAPQPPPEQLEQLDPADLELAEPEPTEPEPEALSDADFYAELRRDVENHRATPRPELTPLPSSRRRRPRF